MSLATQLVSSFERDVVIADGWIPDVAELLAKSLAEEEGTDNLLTQIARELMGQARTGTTKAPKVAAVREN
jgi:hypothetical protein